MPAQQLKATHYHRAPIRCLNAALRVLNKAGICKISLHENDLITAAQKKTGLTDFGHYPQWREQMRILLASLETQADLNPVGRFLTRSSIERLLIHRLYVEDLLKKHPEILERDLGNPVVIVGLARSGTTRLHRLLAADERFLNLKSWESVYPAPWPDSFIARDQHKTDPRITNIEMGLKAVLYMSPQIAAVHPLGAMEIEEELGLLQHSFSSQIFEIITHVPDFAEYLMQHDQTFAYEYMTTLMKIISWFRNDPPGKPWILKTPQHMQDLDALMRVFPNAKIICPHRDPIKAIGSVCSTAWNAIVRDSDSVTPDWIGPEWLDKSEKMLRKTLTIRRDMIPAENQYDVLYADISADWQSAMQGIYDFLGLPLTDQAKTGMQAWLDQNNQHQHGAHKYSLSDFGLDKEQIDQKLMFYRERFNIPYETRNPHIK